MAKSKRNARTSKTDHVLSLLGGAAPASREEMARPAAQPAPDAPSEQSAQPAADTRQEQQKQNGQPAAQAVAGQAAAPARQPAPREGERLIAPILQVEKNNSEALSRTIRDALEETLEEETAALGSAQPAGEETPGETAPAQPEQPEPPAEEALAAEQPEAPAEAAPTPEAAQPAPPARPPVPEEAVEQETARPPEPEQAAPAAPEEAEAPAGQTPAPQEADAPAGQTPAPEAEQPEAAEKPFAPRETRLPDGAVCLNVMELLVDERLERYVNMFGLCTCPRCMADARALALSRLPAKYVVLEGAAATPMTSLYRAKYESMVVAQVIQACKTVMESPRHTL